MLLPLLILALCALATAVAVAVLYRADARHWRTRDAIHRTQLNAHRRHVVAFRSRP